MVHEILTESILGQFAIPSSSGSRFVRTLCSDPLSWVALRGMAHSFIELHKLLHHDKAVIHEGQSSYWFPRRVVLKNVLTIGQLHSSPMLVAQFSCSVVSDSLQSHRLQQARLPCQSPTPRACSNSIPWSWWCHPTISPSVIPFSSCIQSFPASGSFLTSQLFESSGQSIGVSASASVLPMNVQDWFSLGWTDWISLLPKRFWRVFSNTTIQKHQFFSTQLFLQLSHPYTITGKTIALTKWTFVSKVMSLLFNMLSRLVITFLPRRRVNFMAVVTISSDFGAPKKLCRKQLDFRMLALHLAKPVEELNWEVT